MIRSGERGEEGEVVEIGEVVELAEVEDEVDSGIDDSVVVGDGACSSGALFTTGAGGVFTD